MAQLILKKRESNLNPRQIRSAGFIPVTVYGKMLKQSLSLKVPRVEFTHAFNSKYIHKLQASVEGENKPHLLIIKSIEKNPVTDQILNIQFQSVQGDDLIRLTVPIVYEGNSPLVQAGGSLYIMHKKVDLICPASEIPDAIRFNLEKLQGNKQFAYYSDLELEGALVIKSDLKQVIVKVKVPQVSAAADEPAKK
ncbi:MAG: 50S ribosomal protein L25 [Candidatus Caenarcaniphilales bacterium]|nr:50S ribosomal protein L25 [Candidatus Caenarcaniphilales bacterium]